MKTIATVLLAVFCAAPLAQAQHVKQHDPGQGYKHLHEGNSLMYPLIAGSKAMLKMMAHDMGYPADKLESVGAAGIPMDYIYNNGDKRAEFLQIAREKGPFDLLILQPYGHNHTRNVHAEAAAGAYIYREVLKHSPDCRLMIYFTWDRPGEQGWDDPENTGWIANTKKDIENHLEPLTDILAADFPDREVTVIPVGPAFLKLHEAMQAGKVPGFTSMKQWFDVAGASVHPTAEGYYVSALCHLACMYEENPAGKVSTQMTVQVPWTKEKLDPMELTAEQAEVIQQIAWETCKSYPRTTISGVARKKDDATPPPAATDVTVVSKPTDRAARITWQAPASEAVTFTSVYANGLLLADFQNGEQTELLVTGLLPGEANDVRVRTWDAAYNFADAKIEISTPAQSKNVLAAWDIVAINDQAVPLAVSETAKGVAAGPLQRSDAVGFFKRPFNSVYLVNGFNAGDLAGAISGRQYVTMTVDFGDKPHALDALNVRLSAYGGMNVALLTSITGFDADDVIHSEQIAGNGPSDITFPLRDVKALQKVTGPFELRIYAWPGIGVQGRLLGIGHIYGNVPGHAEVVLLGEAAQ